MGDFKGGQFDGHGTFLFHEGNHSFPGATYSGSFVNGVFEGNGNGLE